MIDYLFLVCAVVGMITIGKFGLRALWVFVNCFPCRKEFCGKGKVYNRCGHSDSYHDPSVVFYLDLGDGGCWATMTKEHLAKCKIEPKEYIFKEGDKMDMFIIRSFSGNRIFGSLLKKVD